MLSEKADGKMAKAGFILESPATYCKAQGLKSLGQLSEVTGKSTRTLTDWHKYQPQLFRVVVAGALAINKDSDR